MTSPDSWQDRLKPAAPSTPPVTTALPAQNARPAAVPAEVQPTGVQGRDEQAGHVEASKPSVAAGSPKTAGPATTQSGGGSNLRLAVQELMASVECLLGDAGRRDEPGAKRHLAEVARILSTPPRDVAQRGATGLRTSPPAPASGDVDKSGDIQQDLQRAMR